MRANHRASLLLLASLVGAPLGAQQMGTMHQGGHRHQGEMMGSESPMGSGFGMDMMQTVGPGPAALLSDGDRLGLTLDQKERLQALADQVSEEGGAHMQAAMAARARAREILTEDAPDLAAYQGALQEASEQMVQLHVAYARAALEAREVLTPDQRTMVPERREAPEARHPRARGMTGRGIR